eukprot:g1907.t1
MLVALGVICGVVVLGVVWFWNLDTDLVLAWKRSRSNSCFEEKVVWITGASQGLGRLLALYFSSRGARLILSSRNEQKLKDVAAECTGKHREKIVVLPFDMQDANWEKIASIGFSCFPEGIDFVIHNTGISQHSAAVETKASIVEPMFHVNTLGCIQLTQTLLPRMIKQGKGQFIVIASMAAKIPSPGQAIYSATKHGLLGYFLSLRTELANSGIGVSVCCPGPYVDETSGSSRTVFGKEGLIQEKKYRTSGVRSHRLVKLIALTAEHNLAESWIVQQPLLLLAYLIQYMPLLGLFILEKIGPSRAKRTGTGDSYSLSALTRKSKEH